MVRRMDRQGEVLIRCRKCSGYATLRMGSKLMKCKPGASGHQRVWRDVSERIVLEDGSVPAKGGKRLED